MPWRETCPMRERMAFVVAYETDLYTTTELSERYGVSRKTGLKWVRRYLEEGPEGLRDRSRRPHRSPGRTDEEIEELLLEVRRAHPRWGPEKLLAVVGREHPERELPARSTVAGILKRHGMVSSRPRRRRHRHPGLPLMEVTTPNELWTADFKGEFKTLNGRYCYPLTIADEHSRYLVACDGLSSPGLIGARAGFERAFVEYGLPGAIRTDNGTPFVVPNALHGLSPLSVWWIQLGIQPFRIEPGKPQQNGRHERMHRTLKDHTTRPPAANRRSQQARFDAFRREFNEIRPHQALGQKTPAEVWRPSPRPYPRRVPQPEYCAHFEKRKVNKIGNISFKGQLVFLSTTLKSQTVALEEIDDGIWSIYYYDLLLGRLDERVFEVIP
jgi:putative transposase